MIRELLARLRFLIRRRTHEELDEELQFHFDQQVEVNVAAGMIAEEARRQAAIAFGGFERAREECREQRPSYWVETFFQDARYALRGFRRNPTFTATIVLTLMLGIGATTAVFSVVDRILFRPLPYGHAERLVSVGLVAPIEPQEFMLGGSYYEWKDHQSPFSSLTSETGVTACDLTEHSPVRLSCAGVEANFLPTLGVSPVVGGNFEAAEDTPNGAKVALISYGLWLTRFNRDPAAVGKLMQIDGHPVRIVGVLPREFEMPRLQAADVLLPQALDEALQRRSNPGRPMWAFARLKDGVSIEQAKAQLEPMFQLSLGQAPPQFRKEVHLRVRSLRDRQVHDAILAAWVLFGLALAVLLLACANVTSLLLARGAARERELAVRSALGASRLRLARQGLTESLALSLAGGGLGCLFAELLLRGFRVIAPAGMQFMDKARIDFRILTFSLVVSILCAGIFGFAPGLHRPRGEALSGRNKVSSSQAVLRQWLVVAQIAISMVLLAGGALLARSFANLQQQGLGMNPERIVTARISLGARSYPTEGSEMALFQRLERNLGSEESKMAFFERLGQTLRYGPGIGAVAMSDSVPPGGDHHDHIYAAMSAEGRPKLASGTG
jgi:predicted permease